MIKTRFSLIFVILWIPLFVSATPVSVQNAFKKMYPTIVNMQWVQDNGYYCARFVQNEYEKSVWFNSTGAWQMIQTSLGGLDELTPKVYNAFVSGPYASWNVETVTMVEFPKWQAIIVIKVGQDNVDVKYQLFYTPGGMLLRTRNVSYMYDILGPSTFL